MISAGGLYLENEVLHQEGFTQFSVYWYQSSDTYEASGTTSSSSGKLYTLAIPIPSGFPQAAPAHVPHLSLSALYGGREILFLHLESRTTCTRLHRHRPGRFRFATGETTDGTRASCFTKFFSKACSGSRLTSSILQQAVHWLNSSLTMKERT